MCESRSQNEQMQLDLPKASCFGRVLCKKYEIQRENLPKLKLRPMVEATGFCSIHVSASMHVGQVPQIPRYDTLPMLPHSPATCR